MESQFSNLRKERFNIASNQRHDRRNFTLIIFEPANKYVEQGETNFPKEKILLKRERPTAPSRSFGRERPAPQGDPFC